MRQKAIPKCPNCGAPLLWFEDGVIRCSNFCGYERDIYE